MFNRSRPEEIHNYVEERLSDYMDGTLPPKERAAVDAHLKECERCAASLSSLQWTVGLLKRAPVPALPRSFTLRVPESQRVAAPRPASGWNWGGLAAMLATFVIVVVLTVGGYSLFMYGSSTPAPAPNVAMAPVLPTAQANVARTAPPTATTGKESAQLNNLPTPAPTLSTFALQAPTPTEEPSPRQIQEVSPTGVAGIQAAATSAAPAAPPQPAPTLMTKSAGASPTPEGLGGGTGGAADSSGTKGPTPTTRGVSGPSQGTVTPTGIGLPAQVVSTTLPARAGPDTTYQEVTRFRLGDIVTVVGLNALGDWFAIRYPENTVFIAWVPSAGVKLSEGAPLPTIIAPTRTPTPGRK